MPTDALPTPELPSTNEAAETDFNARRDGICGDLLGGGGAAWRNRMQRDANSELGRQALQKWESHRHAHSSHLHDKVSSAINDGRLCRNNDLVVPACGRALVAERSISIRPSPRGGLNSKRLPPMTEEPPISAPLITSRGVPPIQLAQQLPSSAPASLRPERSYEYLASLSCGEASDGEGALLGPLSSAGRGRPWDSSNWLEVRQQLIDDGRIKELPVLMKSVCQSSEKALRLGEYQLEGSKSFSTVNLSEYLAPAQSLRWFGRRNVHVPQMPPQIEGQTVQPPIIVVDQSPLDVVTQLHFMDQDRGRPVCMALEVSDFDRDGSLKLGASRAISIIQQSNLVRTDFARFADMANTRLRSGNCTVRDHLTAQHDPYVFTCPNITLFRGSREDGYPFLSKPTHLCGIVTAMSQMRPSVTKSAKFGTGEKTEWYSSDVDQTALLERLSLIGFAALQDLDPSNKAILVLSPLGCSHRGLHPRDAVANSLKHWRTRFARLFHTVFLACGPDRELAEHFDVTINRQLYGGLVVEDTSKFAEWHWARSHISMHVRTLDFHAMADMVREATHKKEQHDIAERRRKKIEEEQTREAEVLQMEHDAMVREDKYPPAVEELPADRVDEVRQDEAEEAEAWQWEPQDVTEPQTRHSAMLSESSENHQTEKRVSQIRTSVGLESSKRVTLLDDFSTAMEEHAIQQAHKTPEEMEVEQIYKNNKRDSLPEGSFMTAGQCLGSFMEHMQSAHQAICPGGHNTGHRQSNLGDEVFNPGRSHSTVAASAPRSARADSVISQSSTRGKLSSACDRRPSRSGEKTAEEMRRRPSFATSLTADGQAEDQGAGSSIYQHNGECDGELSEHDSGSSHSISGARSECADGRSSRAFSEGGRRRKSSFALGMKRRMSNRSNFIHGESHRNSVLRSSLNNGPTILGQPSPSQAPNRDSITLVVGGTNQVSEAEKVRAETRKRLSSRKGPKEDIGGHRPSVASRSVSTTATPRASKMYTQDEPSTSDERSSATSVMPVSCGSKPPHASELTTTEGSIHAEVTINAERGPQEKNDVRYSVIALPQIGGPFKGERADDQSDGGDSDVSSRVDPDGFGLDDCRSARISSDEAYSIHGSNPTGAISLPKSLPHDVQTVRESRVNPLAEGESMSAVDIPAVGKVVGTTADTNAPRCDDVINGSTHVDDGGVIAEGVDAYAPINGINLLGVEMSKWSNPCSQIRSCDSPEVLAMAAESTSKSIKESTERKDEQKDEDKEEWKVRMELHELAATFKLEAERFWASPKKNIATVPFRGRRLSRVASRRSSNFARSAEQLKGLETALARASSGTSTSSDGKRDCKRDDKSLDGKKANGDMGEKAEKVEIGESYEGGDADCDKKSDCEAKDRVGDLKVLPPIEAAKFAAKEIRGDSGFRVPPSRPLRTAVLSSS